MWLWGLGEWVLAVVVGAGFFCAVVLGCLGVARCVVFVTSVILPPALLPRFEAPSLWLVAEVMPETAPVSSPASAAAWGLAGVV